MMDAVESHKPDNDQVERDDKQGLVRNVAVSLFRTRELSDCASVTVIALHSLQNGPLKRSCYDDRRPLIKMRAVDPSDLVRWIFQ